MRAPIVLGNAASPHVLNEAALRVPASKLIIAIPEGFEAGVIADSARAANSHLTIFARALSDEEVAHLQRHGVDHVVMGEREIARRLLAMVATARSIPA
jgi:monovalent cation:H+ antiporter-2, CPA2 family